MGVVYVKRRWDAMFALKNRVNCCSVRSIIHAVLMIT